MSKANYPRCGRVEELKLRNYHMKPGGIRITSGGTQAMLHRSPNGNVWCHADDKYYGMGRTPGQAYQNYQYMCIRAEAEARMQKLGNHWKNNHNKGENNTMGNVKMMNTAKNNATKRMTVNDAKLRLEQLKDGKLPEKTVENSKNPLYIRAYDNYLRSGTVCNTLREGSDSAGGYLVPDEFNKKLIKAMEAENVIRKISRVITTARDMTIPLAVGEGQAYWVPEEGTIQLSDPKFDSVRIGAHKLGTRMLISDELLEDSVFDMEDFIADEFAHRLGKAEEEAFLNGDGKAKPQGLMQQIEVGAITEQAGAISIDDIIDLIHSIPQGYRKKAVLVMNDTTYRDLCKIRSAYDRNIWGVDMTGKYPGILLGVPIVICEAMPNAESGNKPILYGDFDYFVIGDRGRRSIKRLNEVYADRGQVGFQVTQRVDAVLLDKKAIKCLQVQ